MITLKEVLSVISGNCILLIDNATENNICILGHKYFNSLLSEKYSSAIVKRISISKDFKYMVSIYIEVDGDD